MYHLSACMGYRRGRHPRDVSVSCGVRVVVGARTIKRTQHTRRAILHARTHVHVSAHLRTHAPMHTTHVPAFLS